MRIGGIVGLALLALVAATPAGAIPVSDWAVFLEENHSAFGMEEGEPDWEDRLFAAAEEEPDIRRAVARFGREIGVGPEQAERYADAIVAATVLRQRCGAAPCQLDPGQPDYERVMTPALAEPSGELLWVVGRALGTGYGALGPAGFVRAARDHPARTEVLARMYEYTEGPLFLVALLLESPRDPSLLEALRASDPSASGGPDGWDGWQLAIIESAARRAAAQGAPAGEQALYAQAILARYFNLGLTGAGLELYGALPGDVRALLPLESPPCGEGHDDACAGRTSGEVLADELVAALWLSGDRAGAEAFSRHAEARLGEAGQWDSRARRLTVLDAIERSRPAADLFDLMVAGDGLNPEGHSGMSGEGWMFLNYGPAARALVADRLREAGYASIAEAIEGRDLYYRSEHEGYDDGLARMGGFPPDVEDRRRDLVARIEAAWAAAGGGSETAPARASSSGPEGWDEARLPVGVPAWSRPAGAGDEPDAPSPTTEFADLPVPAGAVLRHEVVNGERHVLFQSSELDLPGEIPAYGVWLVRTEGGAWTDPVYLGLQQHFPYVVTPASALPLVQAGRLQIEVQVREIATESITFPPVGLSLAREEDGLVISRDIAEVFSDGDSDGLTDIAERRLGLDPAQADSDGDGAADGVDPVPLVAATGEVSPARRTLAMAVLQQLTGYDAGAIVVSPRTAQEDPLDLEAMLRDMGAPPPEAPTLRTVILVSNDPALFTGLDVPFRLMVYTPEQIQRLSEGGAPFYPPTVEIHSSLDGLDHFVVWSASWVGGNFRAHCPEDGGACEVEVTSSWIT